MKVSIIVPVYNTAPWLDRCVDSLVNQTYKDIEIILVNDGSTDNSRQVCNFWCNNDDRIIYLQQENQGLSAARNTGIENASGNFICFIDSDDCISPFYVEKLLTMCQENDVKIAICGYSLTDETTPVELITFPQTEYHTEILERYNYFERLYTDKEIVYVVAWNKLYHRSVFKSLRFKNGKLNEDEGIIHQTIGQCDKIAVCYEPLYFYAVRQGSITKTHEFKPAHMDVLAFWQDRIEYFESLGWHNLAYLTMKNYLVKCLELYNLIDNETTDGKSYRTLLLQSYKVMLNRLKACPVKSRKFILQMEYYGLFPKKFAGIDRRQFLFGN